MSDFQSYSAYVPQEETLFAAGPQIRQESPVFRTSSQNGATTDSVERSVDRGDSGHGATDQGWKATARSEAGRAIAAPDLTGDTFVTINGLQGRISFFVSEGILQKTPEGEFTEGQGPTEAPQEVQGDIIPVNDAAMSVINAALQPLPQTSLDSLTAQGIGVAVGRLEDDSLVRKFGQDTGLDPVQSAERLTTIKAIYQDEANKAIQSRSGIGAQDSAAFWEWARTTQKGQLQEAVGKQLRSHDVSGYTKLANQWLSTTAPSIAALQAAGIPTRTQGSGPEVYLRGSWMSPAAAARAGLV